MGDHVRIHVRSGFRQALISAIVLFIAAALGSAARLDAAANIVHTKTLLAAVTGIQYGAFAILGILALWNVVVYIIAIISFLSGGTSKPSPAFVMASMSLRLGALGVTWYCFTEKSAIGFAIAGSVSILMLLFVKAPKRVPAEA